MASRWHDDHGGFAALADDLDDPVMNVDVPPSQTVLFTGTQPGEETEHQQGAVAL
jgi:hypothetical protein